MSLQPRSVSYVFDNAGTQTRSRFAALATIFDPGTVHHLTELGVGEGWRCLEVGAGGGSIAAWLCGRVGPTGAVVATNVDTRFLETLDYPNLEVRRHDVVSDSLPESRFDLIHTRLVLMHLPDRDRALPRLVTALKPGGWILAEEFDSLSVRPDPAANPAETACKALLVLHEVLAEHGVDLRYGRRLAGCFRACGLNEVSAEGRMFLWPGRSAGAELLRANFEQLRGAMLASGRITAAELERDLARLAEDDFQMPSAIMWATSGRRPTA